MKKFLLIAVGGALVATAVSAAGHLEVISKRQALMGEIRNASRTLGGMERGRLDYDAAVVQSTGARIVEIADEYGTLFIDGSESGGNTKASPAIWSNRAGFDAEIMKLKDAGSALASASSEADFKAAFGEFGATCRSCHSQYQSR